MNDWLRKHLCDVASLAKGYSENRALREAHRQAFGDAYALASPLARLPDAGGQLNAAKAVAALCTACRDAQMAPCPGRCDWRQPCRLMQDRPAEG